MSASPDASRLATAAPAVPPTVSVVVLSKDEPFLAETLDRLEPQCRAVGAECVVVDASSGRLDHIRAARPWVRWIDYAKPLGATVTIAHQRNVGTRAAAAPVVAFCDAGGTPSDRWLATLIAPLLDGTAAAVGGPVRAADHAVYRSVNDLPDGAPLRDIITCNFAFTRAAFDAVGGFDERYAYGSDVDFGWRLAAAGITPVSVHEALMEMDWGPWKLQSRRSWRYGRARARIVRFHRSLAPLRYTPTLVVYPTWWLLAVASLVVAALTGTWWAPAVPLALLGVLAWRNRSHPAPLAIVADHLIFGLGALAETASALRRPRWPVVAHVPRDPAPYQAQLVAACAAAGAPARYLDGPTRSSTLNLVLAPVSLLRARLRSVRIVHLHWTFGFVPHWATGRITRRACRAWFSLYLATCRRLGLSVVWTAHNVVPHTAVFDDDVAARRSLVRAASAVITLSDEAAAEIVARFGADPARVRVIPPGLDAPVSRPDPDAARARLGWDDGRTVVAVAGRLEPYKGIDVLCDALAHCPADRVALHLAGAVSDDRYGDELATRVDALVAAGYRATLSVGRLSDDELADRLAAAHWVALPFRSITNSASATDALALGTPVILPALPALAGLPDGPVLRYPDDDNESTAVTRLAAALAAALAETEDARRARAATALAFVASRPWSAVGEATAGLYRAVLARRPLPERTGAPCAPVAGVGVQE